MTDMQREIRHKYHAPSDSEPLNRRAELAIGSSMITGAIGGLVLAHECMEQSQYSVGIPVALAAVVMLSVGSRSIAIQANQSIENIIARRQQSRETE